MKKLTLGEMTDAQQMRVRTRLGQEQKMLGRPLTNGELNKVKDQIVTEISKEVEAAAAKVRAQKRKEKIKPGGGDETYSWSAKTHTRGLR
ncbi:DUF3811 domain-containing protein [Morganella psychrotolerans]|uniref:DUF3811 domain-containing protein n=1 Tax=Morganella psychrotolerans TaxID=368603 RepID=A0A1B8HUF0_9GAMM|nr:DUF3811 domain-containing protein [Morganella psychrotolerans]OBU13494.1 hypothetical protein AYY18_01805 [Morganella psychrotolerans]